MSEKTTINLKDDEAALVIGDGWKVRFYFPNIIGDEDNVPTYMRYLAELAVLSNTNDKFVEKVLESFYERVETVDDEEG